jgi:cytochrome c oxidase subunit III
MASPVLTPHKDTGGPERDFGWNPGGAVPADVPVAGVWVAIVAIIMLFAALSGVMVLRGHVSQQWIETRLPDLIYLNSVVLLISSLTLEFSRASLTAGLPRRFLLWLYMTLALGLGFIVGQIVLWHELVTRGIYLATDPSSSFLYLLTGAHALHLTGGIIALLVLVVEGGKIARGTKSRALLDTTAIYWHFMYALWIYILLLLVLKV